jgi:hypothetical protein
VQPAEENNPEKILHCLSLGYDVEVDVWYMNNQFYLGHDEPQYQVEQEFLFNKGLWCHSKNLQSLIKMLDLSIINCFWHQSDDYTVTSKGFVWVYPNKPIIEKSIAVLRADHTYTLEELKKCAGVCSDSIKKYKGILDGD